MGNHNFSFNRNCIIKISKCYFSIRTFTTEIITILCVCRKILRSTIRFAETIIWIIAVSQYTVPVPCPCAFVTSFAAFTPRSPCFPLTGI